MGEETSSPGCAAIPDEWPPASERMAEVLLDVFSQHLINRRDRVVRHAYETLVQQHPYAHGRVHQRPFTALDELSLDEAARDKLVNVVAVFVDEAIEQTLSLIGSVMNTVGAFDTVEYRLTSEIHHHNAPAEIRYSFASVSEAWRQDLEKLLDNQDIQESANPISEASAEDDGSPIFPSVVIGQGQPLWFDYRKWLGKYCTFRRTARP